MSAFTVELAGVPASGKTTLANRLQRRLAREGFDATLIREAAEIAPFSGPEKLSWRFNAWTLGTTLAQIVVSCCVDKLTSVVIDRGLFDAAVWIQWHEMGGRIDHCDAALLQAVALNGFWFRTCDIVLLLDVDYDVALARRGGKAGQIVNRQVYAELNAAYSKVLSERSQGSPVIHCIKTDHMSCDDVEEEAFQACKAGLNAAAELTP